MWWLLAISSVDTWTKDMDKDAKFLHCEEHVSKRCALCKCAVFAKHMDIWMNRMDKDDRFLEYVSKRCVLRTLFLPNCRETWPKIHGQSGRGTIAKCNEPHKNVKEGRQVRTSRKDVKLGRQGRTSRKDVKERRQFQGQAGAVGWHE